MALGKYAEVEQDATRITERRFKEHFEDLAYKQAQQASDAEDRHEDSKINTDVESDSHEQSSQTFKKGK